MTDIMTLNSPPSWQLYRLGQLFRERKEKGSDKDFPPLSVTMRGIVPQLETAAKTDDGDNRKVVRAGDYVINSRSDRKGSGGISNYDGSVSLISIVLEPRNINPRFAHHLLRSPAFQEEFYRWGHGIVADLWTTRYADMRNIRLRVPDLDTQKAIADFLDRETARIDQLIEKKLRLVVLLRERSLSAIEKAVTADANFSKLGHHVKILPGYAFASASFSTNDEDIRLLRGANVSPGRIKWDDVVYWPREEAAGLDRFQLSVGDIVMGMDRPWVSGGIRVAEITELDLPALLLQRVCKIIPLKTLSKEFLKLLLSSKKFLGYFEPELTGVSVPHISGDQIAGFKFPYLPVAQQLERVRACRTVLTSNDAIIERAQKSISRLQEYRAALITAAVTGQIDVRAASHQDATNFSLDGGKTELPAGPVSRNLDPSQVRRMVAAEIIHDHRNVAYLGRIKVHKIMFLAEAHANINEINGCYRRQAAGPYDSAMIEDVEAGLRQDRFYDAAEDPSSQRGRITFTPLDNAGGHKPTLEAMLGDRVAELRRIIGLVQDFSTENTEAIATLYAVWNDALIDGEQPDDERIIRGFREEWHEAKQRFTAESLRTWLDWMRRNDLVSRGSGPHTISAHQPSLF